MNKLKLTVIPIFLSLSACATVGSREDVTNARSAGDNDGITYFLPRQLASISAKRTETRLSKAVTSVSKAQASVSEAAAAVTTADTAVEKARNALIASPDNATSRQLLEAQLLDAQVDARAARKLLTAREASLKAATDILTAAANTASSGGPGAYEVTMSIALLEPSGDPRFAYRLKPRHSVLRDDEAKFKLTRAGLLTSSNVVATDRTADIVVDIATFAGAALGGLPSAGVFPRDNRDAATPKDCANAPDDFNGVVDFADDFDVAKLNDDLQCLGIRLKTEGRKWATSSKPVAEKAGSIDGIVYRTPVEIMVNIEKCTLPTGACVADKGWFPTQVIALSLPQAGPIGVITQDAGFFTKSRFEHAFDSGILTSYDGSRPSELATAAGLPMRVINGFFDGVSKVISLRTGQTNGLTGLSAAELAYANAISAQAVGKINNQKQTSEAELALSNALLAGQLGVINGKRSLSEAELALMRAYYAQQSGTLEGQRNLTAAELALVQMQIQLQSAGINGQTQLTNDQLSKLIAETNLTIARENVPAKLSSAQLSVLLALMRDQNRRAALDRCVAEQIVATPSGVAPVLDICLTDP